MWKLKQIFDGEYGCEERQSGEKEKCLVILANEEGEEKTFEANEDWIAAIEKLSANPLMKIIISKPMAKDCQYKKIVVEKKGDGYQAAKYTEKQVFHDNFGVEDLQGYLMEAIHDTFLQVNAWDETKEYSLLISKKGAVTLRAKASKEAPDTVTEHNRKKNYILDEGQVIPPLVDMGIFTGEGKVVKSMYDKFRQINRFLEFIEDIWPLLPKDRPVHIIDFGCGKSYLTFAMYYYLHELKGLTLEVTGLDLKKDVIVHCNELAKKYHYEGLSFLHGDIADYTGTDSADMVVTLHACDTATDYALYKAMKWHAGVILSVPCCQHEVNKQIACEPLEGALKYGLIKERLSALFTDALRADLLEENGYDTQVLEFIDMEHTPKNILLRAVRRVDAGMADGQSGLTEAEQKSGQCSKEPGYKKPDSKRLAETLQIHTTLQKLLEGELV